MSDLSPAVQYAIASIGGPRDLMLRTTLRRDDCDVWTSWKPVQGFYETNVWGPQAVYDALNGIADIRYDTREDAEAGHAAIVAKVEAVIRGVQGAA